MRRHARPDHAFARALGAALDGLEPTPPDASRTSALDAQHDELEHPSEALLAAYVARELDRARIDELERHVARCARCADELLEIVAVEDDARLAESFAPDVRSASAAAADAVAARSGSHPASSRDVLDSTTRNEPARDAADPGTARRASARATAVRPPRRGRLLFRIAAGFTLFLGALVVAAGAAGWALLQKLEPAMLAGLSDTVGRRVSGADPTIVLAGGPGVRLTDVAIAEDPRFGSDPFATARSAALRLDPGALLRGQVRGDVHLDQPVIRLLRDAGGTWNVASLSGDGIAAAAGAGIPVDRAKREASGAAKERTVRLASASITNGVLELRDRAADRDVTLRDVDLTYASADPYAPARVSLEGQLGQTSDGAQRIALRGEIGPFEGGSEPRWRFDDVELARVPLSDIPGAPAALTGELTFDGQLASRGSGIDTVVMNASGEGELAIANGELRERNLTAELFAAIAQHSDGDAAAAAADVLERARRSPALASALSLDATPFQDIGGSVAVANGAVTFDALAVDTPLFQAKAAGSVSRGGALDAHGTVTLTPAATAAIAALVPDAQRLFAAGDKLEVPFSLAGRWPEVDVKIDVRTAIARLAAPLDPRKLALLPRLAGSLTSPRIAG